VDVLNNGEVGIVPTLKTASDQKKNQAGKTQKPGKAYAFVRAYYSFWEIL
jgi:hypothetical protein